MRLLLLLLMTSPGWAQVTVQEYPVPKGHGIHDVWADAAPNGPVWFSAQGSGHLGILEPKSGKVEFVALGTGRNSGSSPHGVIAGPDGAPWLTDGGQNAIVRVDPRTRAVLILYHARVLGGRLQAGDDAIELGFFPLDRLPRPIAFRSHREALRDLRRLSRRKT